MAKKEYLSYGYGVSHHFQQYFSYIVALLYNYGLLMNQIKGTYKVRNEIETKRNQRKRNETKRNEINKNETKRNEINEMKTK